MADGQKIIDALKEAVAGNFYRVTIDGHVWVRDADLHADQKELMRLNNTLRETLLEIRKAAADIVEKIDGIVR